MIKASYVLEVKMGYEDECAFVGPEACRENLEEIGLDMDKEEAEFFKDFR